MFRERSRQKRQKSAFTLIELLVVISIIALLLSILMPSLTKAKNQAKAVVCQSNLKQWGLFFSLYATDNRSFFGEPWTPTENLQTIWINSLRPYYKGGDKAKFCPAAVNVASQTSAGDYVGGKSVAWGKLPGEYVDMEGEVGSYGVNYWIYKQPTNSSHILYGSRSWFWNSMISARSPDKIPLILDSTWIETHPQQNDKPPASEGFSDGLLGYQRTSRMAQSCINRHDGFVGSAFLDGSARKVGLKELWKLKWHREFNVNGIYTKDYKPGYSPVWPIWMNKFKDF